MSADLLTNAIIGSVLENMEMEQLIKGMFRILMAIIKHVAHAERFTEVGEEIYSRLGGKTDEESIDSMAR